jgi:hypothetical protein
MSEIKNVSFTSQDRQGTGKAINEAASLMNRAIETLNVAAKDKIPLLKSGAGGFVKGGIDDQSLNQVILALRGKYPNVSDTQEPKESDLGGQLLYTAYNLSTADKERDRAVKTNSNKEVVLGDIMGSSSYVPKDYILSYANSAKERILKSGMLDD